MFEKYNKSLTYLVACSGGPDSMALLDMLTKESFNLIVANVNYKTRKESDLEEELVKNYCKNHNIPCFISIYHENNKKESFEVKAREFRYDFFKKVYFENNCAGLFVAHHKDDLIETYLLKKQRNVVNESYLINETSIVKKMNVYRPLLSFYKNELLNYCKENNIPYSIDYTNFMPIHSRNVIREELTHLDKEEIYQKALKEEEILKSTRKEVKAFLKYYPLIEDKLLLDKSDLFLAILLYEMIDSKYKQFANKSLLLKLKEFIKSQKSNLIHQINDNYYLVKEYNVISFEKITYEEYSYTINDFKTFNTPYFKVVDNGLKMQGVYVSKNDFPITIRNFRKDDKIQLKNGNKKVIRLFIDKKVPLSKRYMLPIIENSKHEIIFVYKLYRKYGLKDIQNNFFMVQ